MLDDIPNTKFDDQQLDWQKVNHLMPVIIQHHVSGDVLMLGYMNQEALTQTKASGRVTFYSRTKNRLWTKGETSGNFLDVVSISADCDNDSLLILVKPAGPTCHTGSHSCFANVKTDSGFLFELETLLAQRKDADPKSSYTAKLYQDGTKRIAQKVGEEGVETALAATGKDIEELKNESADLIYHLLVLLQDQNLSLKDVIQELKYRHY